MNKNLLYNIGLGIMATALFVVLIFLWLGWFTRHNVAIQVPNTVGMNIEEALEKLDDAGLRYEISDSVYVENQKKDAITEQDPAPGSSVKPNRIIYLVLNSLAKPKVKVPMLVDQSLNLATVLIKNSGLEVGNIEYKYDEIGNNLVVTQSINGMEVPAGKMVTKGTRIDLLVIKNQRNEEASDSTVKVDTEQQEKPPAEEKPKRKRRNKRR